MLFARRTKVCSWVGERKGERERVCERLRKNEYVYMCVCVCVCSSIEAAFGRRTLPATLTCVCTYEKERKTQCVLERLGE